MENFELSKIYVTTLKEVNKNSKKKISFLYYTIK